MSPRIVTGRGSKIKAYPNGVQWEMRRRRVVLGVMFAGLAWTAFGVVRSTLFLRKGTALVVAARALPRRFAVGEGRPLRMVALGDSTMAGVGAGSLESSLPYLVASGLHRKVEVLNLAVSGARYADVLRQLPEVPDGTDLVVVSASANDATHNTSPPRVRDDLRALLDGLQARHVERVVLSTTPNFRTTPALPWALNRLYASRAARLTDVIRNTTKGYPFVRLADLYEEGTLENDEYAADGFHPNADGYRRWAAIFIQAAR